MKIVNLFHIVNKNLHNVFGQSTQGIIKPKAPTRTSIFRCLYFTCAKFFPELFGNAYILWKTLAMDLRINNMD